MNGKHKTDKHKDNSRTRQTGKSTNTKTKKVLQPIHQKLTTINLSNPTGSWTITRKRNKKDSGVELVILEPDNGRTYFNRYQHIYS